MLSPRAEKKLSILKPGANHTGVLTINPLGSFLFPRRPLQRLTFLAQTKGGWAPRPAPGSPPPASPLLGVDGAAEAVVAAASREGVGPPVIHAAAGAAARPVGPPGGA